MTEKEALLWVLGILGSLCAAVITIDKVLDIIHKYIKKLKSAVKNVLFIAITPQCPRVGIKRHGRPPAGPAAGSAPCTRPR
jgi:hypothetical protein